jgi:hypothetical protein
MQTIEETLEKQKKKMLQAINQIPFSPHASMIVLCPSLNTTKLLAMSKKCCLMWCGLSTEAFYTLHVSENFGNQIDLYMSFFGWHSPELNWDEL